MSRVAKAPISIPNGVEVKLNDHQVNVKGPKGELNLTLTQHVSVEKEGDNLVKVVTLKKEKQAIALAGTTRALVNNMVHGVSQGFERELELVGVGYRAQVKGQTLALSLGYSHPIEYVLRDGVTAETPSNTKIVLKSIDKQLLGQVAAEIRAFRKPEPYKGKGVRYVGEMIQRKETKKK